MSASEDTQLLEDGRKPSRRLHIKVALVVAVLLVVAAAVVTVVLMTTQKHLPAFGHQIKNDVFMLAKGVVMLNHGSYGATPREVMQRTWDYDAWMEQNTQQWFGTTVRPLIIESRQAVADYVGADIDDVVLVDNASTGLNAVLRSLDLMPGDRVLKLSVAYPMVDNTIIFLKDRWGLDVDVVTITLPTSDAEIISAFSAALTQHNYTLAVFEHITSTPSLILPVGEIIALCRSHGTLSVIDGAHAVGQVPLDLKQMDPDFYTSNAHKWLCSAKGGAFLYVRKPLQSFIPVHPTVISNTFGGLKGDEYVAEFRWVGTKTLSQQIAIKDALDLRLRFGDDAWFKYNNDLCTSVSDTLIAQYGYEQISPESMHASLVTLKIPTTDPLDVAAALKVIRDNNIFLVMFELDAAYYVRLSCQVYNELSDYILFAELMKNKILL